MKRINADWEAELNRELASGPLKRKGFTDELRLKIEQRVDEQAQRRKPWIAKAVSVCAASVAVAAFAMLMLVSDSFRDKNKTDLALESTDVHNTTMAEISAPANESFRSGLLIGLRSDDRETTYRTLYIAPKDNGPAVVAQGSGILVPYKRDFWRIESLHYETQTDKYDFFVAKPAEARSTEARRIAPTLFKDDPNVRQLHSEKILFAANQYVSIGETDETVVNGTRAVTANRAWTTTIPELTATRKPVTLNDVFESRIASYEYTTDEWIVARNEGKWVPMVAYPGPVAEQYGSSFRIVDAQLPESVVNHDEPCCSWSEIGSLFPGAKDAFSSPEQDMTVVSVGDALLVYGSPDRLSVPPALSIKLKPKETVVMAQWATDHYVQEWANKTATLLR
jgi:hypothetical protein